MKTVKYLTSVWMFFTISILFFSCVDEEFEKGSGLGDGKSIQLNISAPENTVIDPLTRAAQANSQSVEDLMIFVFNSEGGKIQSEYVQDNTLDKLGKEDGATITRSFEVGQGASGFVCVVANAGDLSGITSYGALEDMKFDLNALNPRMVLFASKQNFNVNDASSKVNAELIRIYSMVTVVVQDSTNALIRVVPESLSLYNIPKEGRLVGDNLISSVEESERMGETLSVNAADPSKVWKYDSHEGGSVLFLYENKQPIGYCMTLPDGISKDQTSKTPLSFTKPITDTQILMGDFRSSFIEIKAGYLEQGSQATNGKIKYRFFLGRNAYDNFDVSRNIHYKVTLTLRGNGGVDEATWRVETEKLPNRLNLSDIYVSYLDGSTSELVVTGDVDGIKNVELKLVDNPNGDGKGFEYSPRINGDGDYVAVVKALSTNVHYYKNKVGELIFTMRNNKKLKTNVYQVPRLVDPIAIYKKAENQDETKVIVKKYNEVDRKYEILKSIGPWEIEIAGSSDNDWFELRTTDGKQTIRPSQGKVLTGDGDIEFVYDPLTANSAQGARYGKIIVRYHNKWCKHEIYLRQGYQPTKLGNETWSLFNATGLDKEGNPGITVYPTQTGWLFKGGSNYAMHPFVPGFMEQSQNGKIQYSDSDANTYDFTRMDNDLKNSIWTDKPQGPCPKGYKVADAFAYRTMVDKAHAYAGFVYDDDPVKGWEYSNSGDAVLLTYDNSCNPAKGIVFIDRDNDLTNIFFGFGKGIMSGMEKEDPKLVNEIGVGHRYRGVEYGAFGQPESSWGWLTVNDCNTYGELTGAKKRSYGGWYWNSSYFGGFGGSHLGKVDFMYNLFSPTPFDIDVPNDSNDDGINVNSNASFVRCVVDSNPLEKVKVNAIFYLVVKGKKTLLNFSPFFSVNNGGFKQVGLENGLLKELLIVPLGSKDNTIVKIKIPISDQIVETTLGELKDSKTEILFYY